MTEIRGKIYQMKNAANNENRFPRTVIEAVYGLSSYLQQQFASLADIYMPIEGISEALTGQEFVYRISPNTIKAKSLTLDKILGRSLAWNQLNGFNDFGTGYGNVTMSKDDNDVVTIVIGAGGPSTGVTMGWEKITRWYVKGHKYLFSCETDFVMSSTTLRLGPSSWAWFTNNRTIWSGSNDPTGGTFGARAEVGATPGTYHFSNVMIIDLTLLYGSEIDGMTDEQILAKFESEYPGYHDFGSKLISNDASALETVGKNVWDEEWESGAYNANTGAKVSNASMIRSKNYIPCLPNTEYFFAWAGKAYNDAVVLFYDANNNFIDKAAGKVNDTFTTPSGTAFLTWYGVGTSYNHDICINLSDASQNGQYEPYWKRTLPLGLNSFKVKDGQGNIITVNGLKSAGPVYDEIVGNKYIQRVGRVNLGASSNNVLASSQVTNGYVIDFGTSVVQPASTAITTAVINAISTRYIAVAYNSIADKTMCYRPSSSPNTRGILIKDSAFAGYTETQVKNALDGSYLDYELATPIEYELVEPLVPTVKAGTTEARVSPNADGLSAPFRADITYSAQENNDSASSQYAAVAGRLLNPQTIWGQTFDGSSPVTGSLSGVQNISMAGNITGAVSISARALTHPSGNLTIGDSGNDDFINIVEDTNIKQQFRLEKGVKFGTSSNLLLEWDATNNALRFHGNFIADGFGSFGGVQPSNSEIFCAAVLGPANYQFVNVAGIVDGPNEEYFVPPSSDAIADGNIDRAHVFATKADIDALSARITALGG